MEASIVDLRYKMNEVLRALDRNEKITVLYRGKVKGFILPAKSKVQKKIKNHPFFGMSKFESKKTVLKELDELRKVRYNAI